MKFTQTSLTKNSSNDEFVIILRATSYMLWPVRPSVSHTGVS